jgi:hypothetical protein
MDAWLQRLRHDLVKRALWPARDLRALLDQGRGPAAADAAALRAGLFDLRDPEGNPCDAAALLARLREDAPPTLDPAALEAFAAALAEAQAAVGACVPLPHPKRAPAREPLERAIAAVLSLEQRFATLAEPRLREP